jgi:hypothetical protein
MPDEEIINLSPHPLVLMDDGGNEIERIPSSGAARVREERTKAGEIGGVEVFDKSYSGVEGLPEPSEGTYYYVSSVVASAASGREDLLTAGEFVRDEEGRIRGIKSFDRL